MVTWPREYLINPARWRMPAAKVTVERRVPRICDKNVLTAGDVDEALATADKFEVDGFVFDCADEEVWESLKDRFPQKPRFLMVLESYTNGNSARGDYPIPFGDPQGLVNIVRAILGTPKSE